MVEGHGHHHAVHQLRVGFRDDPSNPPTPAAQTPRVSVSGAETPPAPKNLFEAAERGAVGFIVRQVERNIEYNINQRDKTAVHLAAREGHARVLKALLHDCDDAMKEYLSNQRDVFGITPVFLSLQRGEESRAAFEYLMQCGGKYNSQSAIKFKPDLLAHHHASDSEDSPVGPPPLLPHPVSLNTPRLST
ncbi:predicted protein [Haematococcus lacustris]|uniref:Uncharacterized protein n=1 Tax=Haematococcus lacustris TaxID=44745 RepID=A0A6A0A068_HAELA|nr:predicted protein [Haematococcus lacustris]